MTPCTLVTGAAGFIGYHLSECLLDNHRPVVGVDALIGETDRHLKKARLHRLRRHEGFSFERADIRDSGSIASVFDQYPIDRVVHLAARTGVRSSMRQAEAHIDSNIVGFAHILECCQEHAIDHLIFPSSSSVYGQTPSPPFAVEDDTDHPLSVYAATKKSGELLAHAYAHLHQLPTTVLRLFTVYGPWGRPDMAYFIFTRAILEGRPIEVYNYGKSQRDFTYIDDVIRAIGSALERPPEESSSGGPFSTYNVGSGQPVDLTVFIEHLEEIIGRKAEKQFRPAPPGDAPYTHADTTRAERELQFSPQTDLKTGLQRFVDWYRAYTANGSYVDT